MTNVKIHGITGSTCTQRIVIICNELGIKYDLVLVDLVKGEQRKPEFIDNMHPFGQVPDTDGTKLYESRAIARYLVTKYGKDSNLMPKPNDLGAYALFEQAASVECTAFDPHAGSIVFERAIKPAYDMAVDEARARNAEESLVAKMEAYERILSKQKYLAGEHVTLADLFHVPPGAYIYGYNPSIFDRNPNVKRWWHDVSSRPSWKGFQ
ncbi:glutathione S-transferase [Ceratobasidium sp. AG-Ba]|nr:glutathione S-transferase [Ceratobasidium sp. AG-Ba]